MRRVEKNLLGLHFFFSPFLAQISRLAGVFSCMFQGGSCAKAVCASIVKFGTFFTLAKIIFSSVVESKSLEDSSSCASLVF